MKRLICIICAFWLCVSSIMSGNMLIFASPTNNDFVKVIGDFETSAKVNQFIPTEWTGYFHQTITADTSNYATGAQGAKITLVTASPNDGLGRVVWSPGATIDMSDADYVQFYVKNSGIVPLAITNLGLSAFAVTADNVNQTDNPTFWSQHLGALYYVTTHDFNALPALVYSNNSWIPASRADVPGFANPGITIPAGYEGFIRVPLSAAEKTSNSYGIGFDIATKDANAAGLTLSIDDFAVVSTADKSADSSYVTFTNYLANLHTGGGNSTTSDFMKVIGDFESAAKVSQFTPVEYTSYFHQTVSEDEANFATGTQGAKITLVTASTKDGLGRVLWNPGTGIDLSDADYFQFYVNNSGAVPLAITALGLSAFVVSDATIGLIPVAGQAFWSQHYGSLYYTVSHDFNALPALVYSNNSWVAASRDDVTGFTDPAITIPAGYEGFIRVPLSAAEKTSNSYGIGFDIATKDVNAAGLTLSIDDFAVVTTADKSKDNTYETFDNYLKSNKTFNYVKVIGDFETSDKINQMQPAEDTSYFNQVVSADNTNYATGTQGVKITLKTASTDVGLGKVLWNPGIPIDLSDSDFVQFYVINSGNVPLGITPEFNSFLVTADTVNQIPASDQANWSQHFGTSIYNAATHDYNSLPALLYINKTWTSAPRTGVTGFTNPGLAIPAGYDGYVRVPLSAAEKVSNSYGIAFEIESKDAETAGISLSIDDIASVSTADKRADSSFVTFADYLMSAKAIDFVKVIGDFETAYQVSQLRPVEYTSYFNQTVTPDTDNFATGTQGAKITLANASTDVGMGKIWWNPSLPIDLSSADYIQIYVRNSAKVPLGIASLSIDSFLVTDDTKSQTSNPTYYSDHIGSLYFASTHDFDALPALMYSNNKWVPALRDDAGGFNNLAITIAAGYEGFIRIPLSASEKISNSRGIGFCFVTKDQRASGLKLSIDDIAVVTANDESADSSYVTFSKYSSSLHNSGSTATLGSDQVKVLTSFEKSDTTLNPISGINWVPYDFGISTKYKYSGSQSYCAKIGSEPAGMEPYSEFEIDFPAGSTLAQWKNADYMLLWIKNESKAPLALGGFCIEDSNGGSLQIAAGSSDVSLLENSTWVDSTVATDSTSDFDAFTIPANYEGFIRINLNDPSSLLDFNFDILDMKFFIINPGPKSEVYFDDLSIEGSGLLADGSTIRDSSAYFGSYKGGIVNDYNLNDFTNVSVNNPDTGDAGISNIIIFLSICALSVLTMYVYRFRYDRN